MFGVTLAAVVATYALRRWCVLNEQAVPPGRAWLRPLATFAALGLATGLAGAAKLNGLAIAIIVPLMAIVAWRNGRGWPPYLKVRFTLIVTLLTWALAAITFVAVNPYLYPQPLGRTVMLFRQRAYEMSRQAVSNATDLIQGPVERVTVVGEVVFQKYAVLSFPGAWLINLSLTLAGIWFTLCIALSTHRSVASAAATVLFLTAMLTAGPALFTPFRWDRYFLFPVVFSTAFISITTATAVRWLRIRFVDQATP
jgi:hypothetical protein